MTSKLGPTLLPALKGQIGRWAFYTTVMKFSEVVERIRMSEEIYQNKRFSDMVQRSVKSERTEKIAEYLKSEEERFFPAMVVAVYEGEPNWLEFSIEKGSAEVDVDLSALDRSKLDSFGFLELTGDEKLFPLDGQHRLAGIRSALKEPSEAREFLSDDEVTVMLVAHEPDEEGRTRSRRLFTVLNKRAVSVKKHETIALDEDDVMAIATRDLIEKFSPLSNAGVVSFSTSANIPTTNHTAFTTIVTLYDMLFDLFKAVSRRKAEELRFNRPDDEWTNVYIACARSFFSDVMTTFIEVGRCLEEDKASEVILRNRRVDGGHVLFRPVGQRMLAQLVGEVAKRRVSLKFEDKGVVAAEAGSAAQEALSAGLATFSDLPIDLVDRPYCGLIWEPETQSMRVARATIVRDVILKRYGLLRIADDALLESRIRASVGEQFSTKDFLW